MDKVGIELVLKENLADRLGKILPILERMDKSFSKMNKTLATLESSQKRVDQQFKNIASSVSLVSSKASGLHGINNQLGMMTKATSGATGQVNMLGRSLGSLKSAMGALAGFVGIYKIMQGVGAVGGSAIDFEKQVKSLQQSNLSPDFQKRLVDESLKLGSSGKYAMSGSDFVSTFKEIRSVSKSPEAALQDLPLIGKLDMQMRQVDKKLEGQAALLPRFFEKFAAFDEKGKLAVADALLKGVQYTGGQVNPGQILQQISTSGTSVVGSDPYKEIVEQIYSIKESAAGAGHGGGGSTGRGRGGVGRQALDRIVNLGIITPAMANMMKEAGMLDGIQASGGTSGHKTLIDGVSGKHVLYRGGKSGGSGNLKTSDVHSFLLRSRPEWMRLHANDPEQLGLDFAAGADALSGNKIKGSFLETRDAHLKHFASLPVEQQKSLEGQLMAGARMTGIDFIMERSVGRYLQSHNILAKGIADQPGLAATGQLAVMDRWDKLMKSLETFGNALGNDGNLINVANTALDGLTNAIKILTENVAPIAKNLADLVPKTQTEAAGMAGGAALGGMIAGPGGAIVGTAAGNVAGGFSDMILNSVDKFKKTPAGKGLYDWGKKNFAPAAGRGTILVPPPDPKSMLPDSATQARWQAYASGHPIPSVTKPPALPQTVINQTFNVHPMAGIDGEKIKKQVADAVMPHLQRHQLKNARKMNKAASDAGGSYSPKIYNAGSGQ